MTAHDPSTSADGGPEVLVAYRARLRVALREVQEITLPMGAPTGPVYPARIRIDTQGLSPLFCLRDSDAEAALVERGASVVMELARHRKTNVESWQMSRIYEP